VKKAVKIFSITITVVIVGIIVLVIVFTPSNVLSMPKAPEQCVSFPQKSILADVMELSPEKEDTITSFFSSVGIVTVVNASLVQAGETQTSFHIYDAETFAYRDPIVVWLSNDDKSINAIYYKDNVVFKDNEIIAKVSDFYVSEVERKAMISSSKDYILSALEFPLSAEFKNTWAFDKQEKNIAVQNIVTAQNAFGLKSDLFFQITFNSWYIPISIIIDGQEILENQ